jgi:hypothetical protein
MSNEGGSSNLEEEEEEDSESDEEIYIDKRQVDALLRLDRPIVYV